MQALRHLTIGDVVVVDVGEETIDCRLISRAGEELTLAPLAPADASYIPSLGRAATLLVSAAGRRLRVDGAVRPGDAPRHLAFAPGAASDLPQRRRAARTGIDLAVELAPLDRDGRPAGPARTCTTSDASLAGLGVRVGSWTLAAGERLAFALALPGGGEVAGTARVLRVEAGIAGLEIDAITPADRTRLAALLLARRAR